MDVIDEMMALGMINTPKQAYCTLDKWVRKGWWDYGCTMRSGWKTEKGKTENER